MRSFKRVISFVISIAIVIGMIPLSAFSVFAEDGNNDSNINYDNIPHNNVIVSPTDRYMTGSGNISGSKIKLEEYYTSAGLLVSESVYNIYGNVLYCHSYIEGLDESYYYLKSSLDGSVIYADKNYLYIDEYISDSSKANKKIASQLIRVGTGSSYDVINVITGELFDYNFDNNDEPYHRRTYELEFHGATILVAKEGEIGIMGTDGELIVDPIFDDAYYTEDHQAIIVYDSDLGYGVYKIDGSKLIDINNKAITYYPSAQLFCVSNDSIWSHPQRITSERDAKDDLVDIVNLDGEIVYSSDASKGTNICYVNELDDSLLIWEQILDNETDVWGIYWKEKNYIVHADGKIIDIAQRYDARYSSISFGYPNNTCSSVNDNTIHMYCYTADGIYENLDVSFYGYIDYDGNMLLDYTDNVVINESKTGFEDSPSLGTFSDGYASISLEPYVAYYINKQGVKVSKTYEHVSYNNPHRKQDVCLSLSQNNSSNDQNSGFYDLYGNPLAIFEEEATYSRNDTATGGSIDAININSRKIFILETYYVNDEGITEYRYGVFFTETKEFTGFIYKNVEGLLDNNEDYQVISCSKSDGTYDVYNSDGSLLFNSSNDFYRFDSGNILVVNDIGDVEQYYDIPLSNTFKIVDINGNEIFSDTNYRFIKKFENDTFLFASMVDVDSNGRNCVGVMNSRGKIVVSPQYYYSSYSNYFEHRGNGFYFGFTGRYSDRNFYLLNEKNIPVLNPDIFSSEDVTECGTFFCYDYNTDEIYLYWLNDSFEFENGLTIYSENDKYTLAIGEELTIYVKTDTEALMQYDGVYTVTSSNTDVVKIESQQTGVVSAVLTGTTVGEAEITISFDDGHKVYATFNVELSNNNVLQYFPESVMNNEMEQIFGNAINCCYQINNSYSGWDDAVASYFTCLKSGGAKVITQAVLSKFGLAPSQKDEYVDEAVIALMNEICKVDTTFSETVDSYSKKWSTAKSHYKATNESLKEFAKYASKISNYSETDILTATSEVIDAYGDGVSIMGEFVDVYDIVAVVLCTESIQIDVVNKLLNVIDPETDLYDGLLRLKVDLSTGFVQRVSSQYINDKVIDDIASSLIENGIVGMDSFSKVYTALAKICINLIVDKYKDAGGVMASDICLAIYITTFAGQIECELNAELLNYSLGRVEDYNKFQWLYNCYTASLCVALENCAAICKPEYSFLKDDANKYLKVIKYNCTFDNFMDISRKTALNNYPVEYQVGLDENGDWILIKKYEQISRFALRTVQTTVNSDEIIYIPSVIDGNKITSIADGAFRDNLNIKGVIIEDGVKRIGKEAFKGCSNLEFIMLGGVFEIGEDAFSECTSLELVSLSSNIQIIKSGTFKDCQALVSITIPENVQSIAENAFEGCSSLNAITFMNDEISLDDFDGGSQLTDIYGRKGSSSEKYAKDKGIVFHEIFKEVINLEIVSLPNSSVFNCDEELNLEGLKLLATFIDGTEITIESGYDIFYTNEPGNQSITVCFRNAKTSFEVQLVEKPLTEIVLNYNTIDLFISENLKLEFMNSIPLHIQEKVVWNSSDESIASVNDGLVRGVSNGEVEIIASLNDTVFATCNVIVNNEKNIELDENNKHCSETFVAPVSGYYKFSANGSTIFAYHETGNTAESGENQMLIYLEKGMMIFLTFEKSYYTLSDYILKVEYMHALPSSIEVFSEPNKQYCYRGINEYDFSGLEVLFTYTDGSTQVWKYDNQTAIADSYPNVLQTGNRIHVFWGELHCSIDLEYRDYGVLEVGESQNTSIKRNYSSVFSFIPNTSESYGLYVEHNDSVGQSNITVNLYENCEGILTEVMESIGYIRYDFIAEKEYVFCISTDCEDFEEFKVEICELTNAESIEIVSNDSFDGFVNDTLHFRVEFIPVTAKAENIEWVSSDTSVATIDDNGVVTLLQVGTAVITATSENGLTATCVVEVKSIPTINCDEEKGLTTEVDSGVGLYKFVPNEDGVYSFFSYNNDFDTYGYILDAEMNELDSDDDSGEGSNFNIQYKLNAGQTYYLKARPYSSSYVGTYSIKIIQLVPATSFEITSNDSISGYVDGSYSLSTEFYPDNAITENITWASNDTAIAEVDDWGNIYFVGAGTATITATTENGLTDSVVVTVMTIPEVALDEVNTVEITEYNQSKRYKFTPSETGSYSFEIESDYTVCFELRDEYGNYITGSNNTFNYQLTAGETYYISTHYTGGNTGSYTFKISETVAISKIEITALPDRMDYYVGFEDFSYYGLKVRATFEDGSTVDWSYDSWESLTGYDVEINNDYFDNTYLETIVSCGGKTATFKFNIKENPVDHLELVSGTSRNYIENYNGYINSDGNFIYWTNYPDDAVIKIVYTDGTFVTAKVGEYVDNHYISWNDDQSKTPWIVGADNSSTITYLGHTVNLPITVEKNKVASIEVVSGKVTCIENAYGYETGDSYYYHYDVPTDVSVKINYTDGTSKTVGIRDNVDGYGFSWDDEQHETPWVLGDDNYLTLSYLGITTQLPVSVIANPVDHIEINSAPTREYVYGDMEYGYSYSDGDYEFYPTDMTGLSFTVYYTDGTSKTFTYEDIDENDYINGYGYNLYYDEYNPEIGNFPVTFEYMGKSADYTVLLKESTVTSIAVTKKPTKTEYTNDYSPDFIGMELTITYTDGTTKVVTLTEDDLVYEYTPWWGELCYKVEVDGHTLTIEPYYGEDMYYVAYYLGSRCEIKDVTFTESKEIKSVELDNVSWNGDGMIVKITYADETTETLTLDIADFYDFEDSSGSGYGKTDNGLLYYYIETYTDESGNVEEYIVSILGKDITVEAETVVIGDVNGDGDVNNKDVTMLRRYLIGGWNVIIDEAAADINGDGDVNNKDVTMLRRYLIGGWNVALG